MEFGIFHEFWSNKAAVVRAEAFAQSFAQVAAAEEWGLDVLWLAEIHMNPTRSLLSAPLTVASAIAARTHRIKIGTAVQILPLGHLLRLAEETATIDQISQGRLIFGVTQRLSARLPGLRHLVPGKHRSASPRASTSSRKRGQSRCARIAAADYEFDNFTLVPRPVQTPHPPIRIAASQPDTYSAIGALGYPLFSAVRASPLTVLPDHARAYREAWAAGHAGQGELAICKCRSMSAKRARPPSADAEAGMMQFSQYRADLIRGPLSYEQVRHEKGIVGTPDMVAERLAELRETAGIDGVSAEINPGRPSRRNEQVMRSLRLYCQEVMPRFK